MTEDRIPPHDLEVEKKVLGDMVVTPEVIDDVMPLLSEDSFYSLANRNIFRKIKGLHDVGMEVSYVNIISDGEIDGEYLRDCFSPEKVVWGGAFTRDYCKILIEMESRRLLIDVFTKAKESVFSGVYTSGQVLQKLDVSIQDISSKLKVDRSDSNPAVNIDRLMDKFEFYKEHRGEVFGISTGYARLDNVIQNWDDGEYVLLAGRPSMGKSAIALNFARLASLRNFTSVGIIATESTATALWQRIYCQHAQIDRYDIEKGNFSESQWAEMLGKLSWMKSHYNIHIVEAPASNEVEIKSLANKLKKDKGIKLLILDHVQQIEGGKLSRYESTTKISGTLKSLAIRLKIPVIAVCQLSRMVTQREQKYPVLSDLRDSGALEQDADKIIFTHRENYYKKPSDRILSSDGSENFKLIVAKNRDGRTGNVDLKYYEKWGLVEEFEN